MATTGVAQAQTVLLRDDFNNRFDTTNDLNPLKWKVFGEELGYARTQFGNKPSIASDSDGTSFARLKLSTYNHNLHPIYTLKGTEMTSGVFARENGKEFEARVRTRVPGGSLGMGIVSAFWTFGEQGQWGTTSYKKDEIDIEFLTNRARNSLLSTNWNDWSPLANYAYNDGVHHSDRVSTVTGLNWDGWNTYKIRWLPDRTEWYVNGVLYHSSAAARPDDPMGVRFNIWAPDHTWADAYSATLAPTTNATANTDYFLDVDWVEVRNINPVVSGTGSGLSATYFDNKDLSGPSIRRIDPQINFDWANGSPDAAIGSDTFSAVWTGEVEAQYSQTYTFSTLSDDGVRLWVDGRLLIDRWVEQGPTAWSGTIDLVAGRRYAIRLEYYENLLGAVARLRWSSASTPLSIIPQSRLYPTASVTPTPIPTATPVPTPTPTLIPTPTSVPTPTPVPTVMPPAKPTGLTAVPGNARVRLSWSVSQNAATYTVRRAATSGGLYSVIASGVATPNYVDGTAPNGVRSFYVVVAVNAGGQSAPSDEVAATPQAPPTAPTNLSATAISATQINLAWVDNAANEDGFQIESSINGSTFTPLVRLGANIRTFSNSGLGASTTRFYRVRAFNVGGSSVFSNVSSATTMPPPGLGTGLQGQYFDNMDFTNLKFTRIDDRVDFRWGTAAPDASMAPETFSVRWTGFVQPAYTQTYVFTTKSDDGVRLWINGQLVIDRWVIQPSTEVQSIPLALNAGQKYSVRLEYYDNTLGADVNLSWSSASQAKQTIPRDRLYPQ